MWAEFRFAIDELSFLAIRKLIRTRARGSLVSWNIVPVPLSEAPNIASFEVMGMKRKTSETIELRNEGVIASS